VEPSAGGWSAIYGRNLSSTTRAWNAEDLVGANLPVQLDGVSVTIAGKPAYVGYVSPEQLNVIAPAGLPLGDAKVSVTSAPGRTGSATSTLRQANPSLFLWEGRFAVAQHSDYRPVGVAEPAKPGEVILLYGTGFGATEPATGVGELARVTAPLAALPEVRIGGVRATVEFAGIAPGAAGLYQVNVRVPESAPDGELRVAVAYAEVATPAAYLTVRR